MDQTGHREPTIREISEHMKQDLYDLRAVAERRRQELYEGLKRLVHEHPLASVGVAFGAGYLLSGALLSRATARVLAVGARWYVGRMVRDAIGSSVMSGGAGPLEAGDGGYPNQRS
jgi:hypothetical protein